MAFWLKVPYLNARTALFFHALYALQMLALANFLYQKWGRAACVFFTLLVLAVLFNFARCSNISQSYEWWFDSGNFKVLRYMRDCYMAEARTEPFTFDCNWPEENSMNFHVHDAQRNYSQWVQMPPWHGARAPEGDPDFYYTHEASEKDQLASRYSGVLVLKEGSQYLLRRK